MEDAVKPRSAVYEQLSNEFQRLLTLVAQYRNEMSQAKTSTKIKYYQKKIDKVRPHVLQLAEYINTLDNKNKE